MRHRFRSEQPIEQIVSLPGDRFESLLEFRVCVLRHDAAVIPLPSPGLTKGAGLADRCAIEKSCVRENFRSLQRGFAIQSGW
jgi:hypothetical protein